VLTLAASVVAMLAGWVLDSLLDPYLDGGNEMMVTLVVTSVVFFLARQWLTRLRDG